MTQKLDTLGAIASNYDAIVLDQWGVLHDGTKPYSGTIQSLRLLKSQGHKLAVLSNSGKRAAPNAKRIADMGFDPEIFVQVMTSGEALYQDIADGTIAAQKFFVIERGDGDAKAWAQGLDIELVETVAASDAILIMGLPDGALLDEWQQVLQDALDCGKHAYCSNPDRQSPRADRLVISPGALAFAYKDMGGGVTFYGKPHRPIFDALKTALNADRLLMVGDSLEHDIAGGAGAGWDTLLIQGGLYASEFSKSDTDATLQGLMALKSAPAPTYRMEFVR